MQRQGENGEWYADRSAGQEVMECYSSAQIMYDLYRKRSDKF